MWDIKPKMARRQLHWIAYSRVFGDIAVCGPVGRRLGCSLNWMGVLNETGDVRGAKDEPAEPQNMLRRTYSFWGSGSDPDRDPCGCSNRDVGQARRGSFWCGLAAAQDTKVCLSNWPASHPLSEQFVTHKKNMIEAALVEARGRVFGPSGWPPSAVLRPRRGNRRSVH